jgi:uncharacterized protein with FMN-binding domain
MTRFAPASPPPSRAAGIAQSVKKLLLTSAVFASFSAYAAYAHFTSPTPAQAAASPLNPAADAANPTKAPRASSNSGAASPQPSVTPTRGQPAARATPTRAPVVVRPTATPSPTPLPPAQAAGAYKDGVYTGDPKDAYWGNVQVQAIIKGGLLADVQIVDYPSHRRTSVEINDYAMPYLQSEAIQAQSARVDLISGATLTSEAYARSLQSALLKAKR